MWDSGADHQVLARRTDRLGQIVERLAATFGGGPAHPRCEIVETHISYVLLAGQFAYKFKKPVDFGFVDFTTLERRRHFCVREVELNRRFAPRLYLGVVPIGGTGDAPRFGDGVSPLEYAVKMRRFPARARADAMLARGALGPEHMTRLAQTVATFHAGAARVAAEAVHGGAALVRAQVIDNLDQLCRSDPDPARRERYRLLRARTVGDLDGLEALFTERKTEGFIRDCHGDLHLTNLVNRRGRLVPFDCIEFNDALRLIDVLSDIAFLIMDLEFRGRCDLARRFLNVYLECNGDYAGLPVMPVYLAYRSLVRAKVALLQSLEAELPDAERAALLARVEAHLALAEDYRVRRAARTLYLMHGLSGSGKSTFSERLAEVTGAIRVRSDIERRRLRDPVSATQSPAQVGAGNYTAQATAATYRCLLHHAGHILDAGYSAIIDASFLSRAERDTFRAFAARRGVDLRILECHASEPLMCARLVERARAGNDPSEATVEVLESQLRHHEPLTPHERLACTRIDTADEDEVEARLKSLGR